MFVRREFAALLAAAGLATLAVAGIASAQDLPMKVKGGHTLGETAEQFFAEGHEKEVLDACASGNLKSVSPDKRAAKLQCHDLADIRQQATSGKRTEYKISDPLDMRADAFTFDAGRLVRVQLVYAAPDIESNYKGHTFDELFSGLKQAYGPPTSETKKSIQDTYGAQYTAHHEVWVAPDAAVLIDEMPGPQGKTTVVAFTRAEYERTIAAKQANPLE